MSEALLLEHVCKSYHGHEALRDLSLTVPDGAVYGILGPNGAGKSTTLRMCMNIISSDAGTIRVLGEAPSAPGVLRRVGYLPEERGLYRRMKVLDVIVFFARLKGVSARVARQRGEAWLERMGLAAWGSARVEALSKGMQQKVQFITTVLHEPELLILDEPHSGLDPVNQEVLRDTILASRAEGRTVVLSTHNMDQAEALCDSVCIITGGRKVLDGPVPEIRRAHAGLRYVVRVQQAPEGQALAQLRHILERGALAVKEVEVGRVWHVDVNGGGVRSLLGGLLTLPVELEQFERVRPTLHEIFLQHARGGPGDRERTGHA